MNSLSKIRLGDVATFRNGLNFNKSSNGQKIKIIGVSNFKNRLTPDYSELDFVEIDGSLAEEDYLKVGDIVFVRSNGNKALVARSLYIDKNEELSFSGFCIKARINNENVLLSKYFSYFTKTNQFRLAVSKGTIGTNINNLNQGILSDLIVPAPDVASQQTIVNTLSTFDSKIELNNRINAELEAMAKTIYDYWFVQFDFPISKELATQMGKPELEGRPYKSSGGKMVYNKELKREVPEGWGNCHLSEIGDIIGGSTPSKAKKELFTNGGKEIAWITPKDLSVRKGKRFISYGEFDVTEAGRKSASLNIMPKGTVLLSSRAPVGYMAIARNPVTTNQGFKSLVPVDGFSTEYVFLTVELYLPSIIKKASGSTFAEISASTLKTVEVTDPPKKLIEKFTFTVAPFFAKQDVLEQENQELASLRDWLLPMLMNGQVKVGEAKEYVQEEKLDRDQVGMAAENREEYGKLAIPANKAAFAKQVLGGKIVSLFKEDPHFTHIKFQKLQYLAEQIAEADLNWNYYRQAAGPYDPRFMHSVALKLKRSKWFAEKDYRYYSLEKVGQVDKYYLGYFGPKQRVLQNLFDKLYNFTEDESEIIATLYAVWNNRILDQAEISDDLLISDFREWSSRKLRYSDEQLLQGLEWMNKTGFIPRGFGYKIKEKKVN